MPKKGYSPTVEHRKKLSEGQKRRWSDLTQREIQSDALKSSWTEERRKRQSVLVKGKSYEELYGSRADEERRKRAEGNRVPKPRDFTVARVEVECLNCGNLIIIRVTQNQKFCSRFCVYAYNRRNEVMLGEGNPNYQGGISVNPYPHTFSKKLKREIFERDNFTCFLCSRQNPITVHHIDYDKENNSKLNLITMCYRHNIHLNRFRNFWVFFFRYFKTPKQLLTLEV